MSEFKYIVPSIADEQVYDAFNIAFNDFFKTGKIPDLKLRFWTPINNGVFEANQGQDFPDEVRNILRDSSNKIITQVQLSFTHYSITYLRTPPPPANLGITGELKINYSSTINVGQTDLFRIITTLHKMLFIGMADLKADSGLVSTHSEILSKLEAFGLDLQKDTKKFRDTLEKEHIAKAKILETEFASKKDTLEEQYNSLFQDLEKTKKELDDKSNTHARREIRKDLASAVNKRMDSFKLSKDTSNLRIPIHVAFILLILSSGIGAVVYSKEFFKIMANPAFSSNSVAVVLGIAKPLCLTVLFSTVFILYIKWLNAWFDRNAEEEIMLRKFQLDIDRSSWIVETVLESVSQHDHQLPTELILKFSNNLFSFKEEQKNSLKHPADELASALFGSASKAKLNIGGNEIELDKKSIKELGN